MKNNNNKRPRGNKTYIIALKYIPIISAFLMFLHVVFLECGITLCIAELSVLTLVTLMVLLWSIVFKFCIMHILSSFYTIIVLWCCYIQRFIGFGNILESIRISVLYLGIFIFLLLGYKHVKDYKKLIANIN